MPCSNDGCSVSAGFIPHKLCNVDDRGRGFFSVLFRFRGRLTAVSESSMLPVTDRGVVCLVDGVDGIVIVGEDGT